MSNYESRSCNNLQTILREITRTEIKIEIVLLTLSVLFLLFACVPPEVNQVKAWEQDPQSKEAALDAVSEEILKATPIIWINNFNSVGSCTGVIIGEKQDLLTNSHCRVDEAQQIDLQFGWHSERIPINVTECLPFSKAIENKNTPEDGDQAVLCSIDKAIELPFIKDELLNTEPVNLVGSELIILGYPGNTVETKNTSEIFIYSGIGVEPKSNIDGTSCMSESYANQWPVGVSGGPVISSVSGKIVGIVEKACPYVINGNELHYGIRFINIE